MAIKNICVLGGSGFVGTHIISQLCSQGKQVTVLTRRKDYGKHLTVLNNVKLIETDIHEQSNLETHFKNIDAVINLVGILNERGHNGDGFRQAHVELPRKIINACHQNKVKRILHMSALNADANAAPSNYLRTKGEGENHMHSFAGNIPVTSFRPSVIFGKDDSFFNRFTSLLNLTPGIFPVACAYARFAPVYVGDVARCFVDALEDKSSYGQRYNLCGPKEYTLKELVEYTAKTIDLKCKVIALPDLFAQLQAHILEWVPGKPFSIDNFQSLQVDSVCEHGSDLTTTTAIETIVPYYLGPRQHRIQQDKQRMSAHR